MKQAVAVRAALAGVVLLCVGAGCAHPTATAHRLPPRGAAIAPPPAPALTGNEPRVEALARFATGVALELSQGVDAALVQYRLALAADPHNVPLAIRMANICLSRKQTAAAIALLEQTTQANPHAVEPWFWLGIADKAADQTAAAEAALRHALKLDPAYLNATQGLLELHLQQDAPAAALQVLDHAWAQKVTDPAYWLRLGDLYEFVVKQKPALTKQVAPDRVQRCYEKAQALAPNIPDVLVRLAAVYDANNQPAKAAALYAKLVATHPNDTGLRLKLASSYLAADNKEKAAVELEEIIKREPLRFEIYNYLAEVDEDLKQDDRALNNYQQSLVVKSDQLQPYLRIALIQLKRKQFTDARASLATAKEKFPTAYQIPYFQGLVDNDQKEYRRAVISFAEAETLAQESAGEVKLDSSFYFYYGSVCERAGDLDQAAKQFRKSIELDPNQHLAYNYLGYMWADKGIHLGEAFDLIKKAVERDPDNGAYLDSLGWVLFKLGHHEQALTQLRRACALIKDDPVVFEHLADVLLALGKQAEAVTQLQRAHQMDPRNKSITEKLQKLTRKTAAKP